MTSLEDGIRRCLAPFDVRVNVLCPVATVSSLTAGIVTGDKDYLVDAAVKMGAKYAGGKAPMPRDMANAALFVASDESAFMNGAFIVIDSGKEVLSDRGRDKFYHCGVAARVLSWQHPHGQRTGSHFARPLESGRS